MPRSFSLDKTWRASGVGSTTFNASGNVVVPYGKNIVAVTGKAQDGNPNSGGNYAGLNPSSGGNYAGLNPSSGGNYAGLNPSTGGTVSGSNPPTGGNYAGTNPPTGGNYAGMNPGVYNPSNNPIP
jgi:hypothetical protein